MKKTLSTITLAAVLTLGATFANAGIIIGSRTAETCTETQSIKDGIIIGSLIDVIYQFTGILVAERTAPCTQAKDGIIIGS